MSITLDDIRRIPIDKNRLKEIILDELKGLVKDTRNGIKSNKPVAKVRSLSQSWTAVSRSGLSQSWSSISRS